MPAQRILHTGLNIRRTAHFMGLGMVAGLRLILAMVLLGAMVWRPAPAATADAGVRGETLAEGAIARIGVRYTSVYKTKGMNGVASDVEACYRDAQALGRDGIPAVRECMAYDSAAEWVDSGVRATFKSQGWRDGVPDIPYLAADQFRVRAEKYRALAFKGWDADRVRQFFSGAVQKIAFAPLSDGSAAESSKGTFYYSDLHWHSDSLPPGMRSSKPFRSWEKEFGVDKPVTYAALSYIGEENPVYIVQSKSFATSGYPHLILIKEGDRWRELLSFRGGFIINGSHQLLNDIILYERAGPGYTRLEFEYVSGQHKFRLKSKTEMPRELPFSFYCYFWSLQGQKLNASECKNEG